MPRIRIMAVLLAFVISASSSFGQSPPITVAESSNYQATSSHADVLAFCEHLARIAPETVRLSDLGLSHEGRRIPCLIIADPPVNSPAEAAATGKLVIFAQGNIHAGEVDGKEALLMVARDLALGNDRALLKKLIVAIAPIVNPDGNERFSAKNRPHQGGPVAVGQRPNAQGMDLNRDFVKLDTPEVRAMVRFYRLWDPAVVIDTHTTNGSRHRYTMTYDGPRHPAAPAGIVNYVRDTMLPDLGKRLEKKTGFASYFYGNFNRERTRWESYPAQPRYGTQYVGLRGRVSILSESYAYASYRDRVIASREFVRVCLEHVSEQDKAIRDLLASVATTNQVALRQKPTARPQAARILGFAEDSAGKALPNVPKEYSLEQWDLPQATIEVARPYAYLLDARWTKTIETLQRHGIAIDELREDIDLEVTASEIQACSISERPYQGHALVDIEVAKTRKTETRRFEAGTKVVKTSQRLGTLAAYLLEAESEDSLAVWNCFDGGVGSSKTYPVFRLEREVELFTTAARPLVEERPAKKRILPDHLLGKLPPPVPATFPQRAPEWLEDGEHYIQGRRGRQMKVHAATGKSSPLFDPKPVQDALVKAGVDAASAGRIAGGATMNPKRTALVGEFKGDLYFASIDGKQAGRLTNTPNLNKELISFSPDGARVAFVAERNLYCVDLEAKKELKLTNDTDAKVLNGKADWVYFEEIFNRNDGAYWWTGDSKSIAFLRFDDNPVGAFTVVDHLPLGQRLEQTPYPKSGQPNPLVKLGIASAIDGKVQFADLPGLKPEDTLIVRASSPEGSSRVLFYVQNRTQTWLDVMAREPNGEVRKLFRETTRAWVEDQGAPHFLKDGSFLFQSERDGYRHLYHYAADGTLIRRLTEGPWEVRNLHRVDEAGGWVYYSATADSPTGLNLYRVSLTQPGKPERLTDGVGNHSVSVSPTGSYFIDNSARHDRPTTITLRKTDGSVVRKLDTNPVYPLEDYELGKFQMVQIPLRDGFVLEGSLLLPVEFDPNRNYPVWFMTYGGPHAPTISDTWSFRLLDHVLSGLGIIVFRCDPRSASGKGAISTWSAYKQMGVQELKDIEEALDWLIGRHPYVDPARIGMSGSSYGGFLTAYALTHSKKFRAGIATAPVTEWGLYDSIYTERYMLTPKENAEGYAKTSVTAAAKNLNGRLLLVHGIMDDNVHVQNSVKLMEELQRAGQDFEVMFYPRARHGIGGPNYQRHYQKLVLEFIRKTMGK